MAIDENKQKALAAALGQIEKQFGKGSIMRLGEDRTMDVETISTAAALGVPLATLLRIVEPLCRSGKLQAVDLVEFNPLFDIDGQGARAAARVAWQIAHWWR